MFAGERRSRSIPACERSSPGRRNQDPAASEGPRVAPPGRPLAFGSPVHERAAVPAPDPGFVPDPSPVTRSVAYERRNECRSSPGGNPSSSLGSWSRPIRCHSPTTFPALVGKRSVTGMPVAGESVPDPVGNHFRRPLPNRQDGTDLLRRAAVGFTPAHPEYPMVFEKRSLAVARKIRHLQVAQLVRAQSPSVGCLARNCITPCGKCTLATRVQDPHDLEVGQTRRSPPGSAPRSAWCGWSTVRNPSRAAGAPSHHGQSIRNDCGSGASPRNGTNRTFSSSCAMVSPRLAPTLWDLRTQIARTAIIDCRTAGQSATYRCPFRAPRNSVAAFPGILTSR